MNRKDPFHINRDVVRDNVTVTRKLRLSNEAEIRARKFYATANVNDDGMAAINMPFAGNLYLTVNDTSPASSPPPMIIVSNPFITGETFTKLVVSSQPSGADASFTASSPGEAVLLLGGTTIGGEYVLSVGEQTTKYVEDAFSQ